MSSDPLHDRPGLSRLRAVAGHDLALLVATGGVCLVGALLVWSATHRTAGTAYLVRHLLNTAIGFALAMAVTRIGRQRLRFAGPFVYAAGLAGLVAVLTPLGATINGSRSWIPLAAGFTLQPSEFAKVGIVLGVVFEGLTPEQNARLKDAVRPLDVVEIAGQLVEGVEVAFHVGVLGVDPLRLVLVVPQVGARDLELELGEPFAGNGYEAPEIDRIPWNLPDAIALWENSAIARECFGDEVHHHILTMAKAEWMAFNQTVTDWELRRYWERI